MRRLYLDILFQARDFDLALELGLSSGEYRPSITHALNNLHHLTDFCASTDVFKSWFYSPASLPIPRWQTIERLALTNIPLTEKTLETLSQLPSLKTCLIIWPKMDGSLSGARASKWDGSGLAILLHSRPKRLVQGENMLPKAKLKLSRGRMTLGEFMKRWFCNYVERGLIWGIVEGLPTKSWDTLSAGEE